MKISFIEPHLKIYGGIRRIIELSNRLTKRGHDVTIFHSDGSPCEWMKCIAKIKDYKSVLKEEHDVIIYNDPNSIDYSLVKKAKVKLKVFYVLELYDKELLKGFDLKIYLPGNERMLFLKKSLCSPYLKLSNATWEKEWLKENMSIDSKLLLGGVNFEMFHPIEKREDTDDFRILCSGDPRERKGTKNILKAFEIVKKEEPKIVLDTYHGKGIPQGKMAEKYCSANVFVEGSWQAGWNNPVAEAMACKIPVVCTDIGGVKDFAFHEKTALLVPPEDPQAMASAIIRLIKDENLRKTLSENAYEHIKTFNWDKSAERLEEILNSELSKSTLTHASLKYNILNLIPDTVSKLLNITYSAAVRIKKYSKIIRNKKNIQDKLQYDTGINPSYIGRRDDILSLIPDSINKVLDVGCSIGALGEQVKRRNNNVEVIGIETDEQMAKAAKEKIDRVIMADIERINLTDYFTPNYFDCIIFADVLEHLKDPWAILKNVTNLLTDSGFVIISIPNVRHYTTIFNLLFRGYWPYRERGIHDKNHLRFFTFKNIKKMLLDAGLNIIKIKRNYRIIESPSSYNRFSKIFAFYPFKDFITFQYLVVAKKGTK